MDINNEIYTNELLPFFYDFEKSFKNILNLENNIKKKKYINFFLKIKKNFVLKSKKLNDEYEDEDENKEEELNDEYEEEELNDEDEEEELNDEDEDEEEELNDEDEEEELNEEEEKDNKHVNDDDKNEHVVDDDKNDNDSISESEYEFSDSENLNKDTNIYFKKKSIEFNSLKNIDIHIYVSK
jgi:hypothetical protein